jgi:hypothetical protein
MGLIHRAIIAAALLAGLGSCSTVIEGKSQELTINSIPAGADCAVIRKGEVLARVPMTPGSVTIEKNRHDINVICHKDGFETASAYDSADIAAATFGNVVVGGVVGVGVDAATGSADKYESEITVVLPPKKVKGP